MYLNFTSGVWNLSAGDFPTLMRVFRPFYLENPLLGAKYRDCILFFAALELYLDERIPRYVRLLNVAMFMFEMNTQGAQRVLPLDHYLTAFKAMFPSQQSYEKAYMQAKARIQVIDSLGFPPFTLKGDQLEDYFIGLTCGDGSFMSWTDFRASRKIKYRKEFSISLIRHARNELLLAYLANKLFYEEWNLSATPMTRSHASFRNLAIIEKVQEFFDEHYEKLPRFKRIHFRCWKVVDALDRELAKPLPNRDREKVVTFVKHVYLSNEKGTWRRYDLDATLDKFIADWLEK
jgi:hypothetical protein